MTADRRARLATRVRQPGLIAAPGVFDGISAKIADRLGFDEPTNFSKYFKREAGCTPADFRQRQRTSG